MEVPNLKSIRRYFLVFHLKTFTNLDRLLQTLLSSLLSHIESREKEADEKEDYEKCTGYNSHHSK